MAFTLGLSDRFDGFRLQRSNTSTSNEEPTFSFYNPTPRISNSRPASHSATLNDTRNSLQRRFTTQSVSTLSSLSSAGQQRRSGIEVNGNGDQNTAHLYRKAQLLEKKQAEFDYLRQKKIQFQQEMELLEAQARREEEELHRLRQDLGHVQSEPTTPPELQENGFPSMLSRPNRFSASSIMSPPGIINRPSRAGSQVTSPPVERARAYQALTGGGYASQSIPGSRHESDGDENGETDEYSENVLSFNHRSAASRNRNSMPVTRRDHRQGFTDLASAFGAVDTATFLFGDEDDKPPQKPTSRPASGILSMSKNGDNFPVLIRSEGASAAMSASASQDAIDLALSQQTTEGENDDGGWPSAFAPLNNRTSMPPAPTGSGLAYLRAESPPPAPYAPSSSSGRASPTKTSSNSNRHSMGARMTFTETKRPALLNSLAASGSGSRVPTTKLQTSFSTSNVPTVNSLNDTNGSAAAGQSSNMNVEQRLHAHNTSLGRVPTNTFNSNRHSRDLSTIMDVKIEPESAYYHGAATAAPAMPNKPAEITSPTSPISAQPYQPQTYYNFSVPQQGQSQQIQPPQIQMQMLNAALGGMQISQPGQAQFAAQMQNFQQPYSSYQQLSSGSAARFQDSQARVIQQRRNQTGEENARFHNIALENLKGEIYSLCKDQHGCRYLQKKLEERKPENVEMIFAETKDHMIELMTDPFGNYLCQKLLEYSEEEQRSTLIKNAAPHMVTIALNQHGTRALQKMIEYVTTDDQIMTVIVALRHEVVRMIQDLNGNHVIQKCLNHLSSQDAQFIFDAVAGNCVAVGTHRHGCCVIQRCIDHATGNQKAQLVAAITNSALPLVQDPFGNYVIQYIFDQNEHAFSQPLCRSFVGKMAMLSKQKFSSNVIEKCLRIADPSTKHLMIREVIESPDFERLADDPYANYVVQTAWDYADPVDENILAERVRPILARMRHKPYGRRFQNRIQERDKKLGIATTPLDASSPESAVFTPSFTPSFNGGMHRPTMSQESSVMSPVGGYTSPVYMPQNPGGPFAASQTNRFSNPMSAMNFYQPQSFQQVQQQALQQQQVQQLQQQQQVQQMQPQQHAQQQMFANFGRGQQQGGQGYFQ